MATELKHGMWEDDANQTIAQDPLTWWNSWSSAVKAPQDPPCG
ncbi:MAG: hypothetical protein ACRDI3_07610 [Actinomycetota bacterium]